MEINARILDLLVQFEESRQQGRHDPVFGGECRDQRVGRHMPARAVEEEKVAAALTS